MKKKVTTSSRAGRTTLIEDCLDFYLGVPLLLELLHVFVVLLSPFLDTLLHGLGNALALRTGDGDWLKWEIYVVHLEYLDPPLDQRVKKNLPQQIRIKRLLSYVHCLLSFSHYFIHMVGANPCVRPYAVDIFVEIIYIYYLVVF